MSDLITQARAKELINQSSFTSAEDDVIDNLIDAVSTAIRGFTKRQLSSTSFDHVYTGRGAPELILDDYPVTIVSRVASSKAIALRVKNTSAANQRARARTTSTGLTLISVASGTTTTETEITWASNATITAVKNAVIAKGNGWTADVPDSDFSLWESSELAPPMGRYNVDSTVTPSGDRNAMSTWAPFHVWTDELSDYEVQAGNGMLFRRAAESICNAPTWERGKNYRVKFTAGYATIPEDLQHAAAEWVATLFWLSKDNPAVYPDSPSPSIADVLNCYRRH